MKILTAAILIVLSAAALAYGHSWQKMSETRVLNAYGSEVVQCVWQCRRTYDHNPHQTITQGFGFCPMP